MSGPLLYESHMHTPLCRHATGEPEEYARAGHLRGLKGIIITCHNPLPDGISQGARMYPEQFAEYLELVNRARLACASFSDVRLGIECDYLPGLEPFLEAQLQSAQFHHVLGSVHPQISEYRQRFYNDDDLAFQKQYFTHLAMAAETRLFDTLSHPDLVKNQFPTQWRIEPLLDHVRSCLDRIARTGVAMELNTSGVNKAVPEMNPGAVMLAEMRARGIPVVIGADAHVPRRVADGYELALETLRQAGYMHVSLFLNRRRREIAIDDALATLAEDTTPSVR